MGVLGVPQGNSGRTQLSGKGFYTLHLNQKGEMRTKEEAHQGYLGGRRGVNHNRDGGRPKN